MLLALTLFLPANAEEPTPRDSSGKPAEPAPVVGRVSRVIERAAPVPVCHSGVSGAAAVSDLTEQLIATVPQVPATDGRNCGSFRLVRSGSMITTSHPDGSALIRTFGNGRIDGGRADLCLSYEGALREQVARLDACPGVTPPPLATHVVERRTR